MSDPTLQDVLKRLTGLTVAWIRQTEDRINARLDAMSTRLDAVNA